MYQSDFGGVKVEAQSQYGQNFNIFGNKLDRDFLKVRQRIISCLGTGSSKQFGSINAQIDRLMLVDEHWLK